MEQISKRLMNWASILEDITREQAERTASMPFIWPHVALMPDAHLGKGSTVGSVVPTLGAIMPSCVGVDIGCGMAAVRTQFTQDDIDRISAQFSQDDIDRITAFNRFIGHDHFVEEINTEIRQADIDGRIAADLTLTWLRKTIENAIPLSAGNYNTKIYDGETQKRIDELSVRDGAESAQAIAPNWNKQVGSLGSGNHFIEISRDEQGRIWIFLHSGSRGVGNKLAVKHIKVARQLCERRWITLPDPDLAYLVEGEPEFWAYIRDLRWAQHFALLNRDEMMHRVVDCLSAWSGKPVQQLETVNCHHNYTEQMPGDLLRRRPDRSGHVWLSRKGAIDATAGKPGLIPGSMGTASYVVEGKGNKLSLYSSPHGAGRAYGRKAAKNTFTREQLDASMKGIEWRHSDAFLDEIPSAYKDIDVVMADAADLVEIKHKLTQIVNVKGE